MPLLNRLLRPGPPQKSLGPFRSHEVRNSVPDAQWSQPLFRSMSVTSWAGENFPGVNETQYGVGILVGVG